jgi:hypothetical protein
MLLIPDKTFQYIKKNLSEPKFVVYISTYKHAMFRGKLTFFVFRVKKDKEMSCENIL